MGQIVIAPNIHTSTITGMGNPLTRSPRRRLFHSKAPGENREW